MPLIQITTKAPFHPIDDVKLNLRPQVMTIEFGEALPALFVAHIEDLHMEPDTPEVGVQVTHQKFHRNDVNAPDMWILVEFSEDGLDEVQQTEATAKVKTIILEWFNFTGYLMPADYACDVRWIPSRGFLRIRGAIAEW